jgi:hypothetical protein
MLPVYCLAMQVLVVRASCSFCWAQRFFDRALHSVDEYFAKAGHDQLNLVTASFLKRARKEP